MWFARAGRCPRSSVRPLGPARLATAGPGPAVRTARCRLRMSGDYGVVQALSDGPQLGSTMPRFDSTRVISSSVAAVACGSMLGSSAAWSLQAADPQAALPQAADPQAALPGRVAPGGAAPGCRSPGRVAPGSAAPRCVAPGRAAPGAPPTPRRSTPRCPTPRSPTPRRSRRRCPGGAAPGRVGRRGGLPGGAVEGDGAVRAGADELVETGIRIRRCRTRRARATSSSPTPSDPGVAAGVALAEIMSAPLTWSGVQPGCWASSVVAAPATIGAEKDVPLSCMYPGGRLIRPVDREAGAGRDRPDQVAARRRQVRLQKPSGV